ncbi:MAG: YdcH family protein [Vicinamibacterales bacterium]
MADAQLSRGDEVKSQLLEVSEPFRQLVTEHQALDDRIRQLATLSFLTDQQQYEEASLKKKKLAIKDRIEALVRSHRTGLGGLATSAGQ